MTETQNPTPADPATFNLEDFLQDANLPQESATVYKRADVVAELTELKRRIELEDRVNADERSSGEAALSPLEQAYEAALQTFSQSALTVYVRALTSDELRDLKASHEERTADLPPAQQNLEFGYDVLAAAIVGVKPAGGERTATTFTVAQVKALKDGIGEVQTQLILAARQQAQNGVPTVDADFLLRRSGMEAGQE